MFHLFMHYIVTMTIWIPELERGVRKYIAIADALERDIAAGRLIDGQQLPTHRELSDALGVTVGTITRAYAEAERRGLTVGEVGRGTFVQTRSRVVHLHRWGVGESPSPSRIDMRHSLAPEIPDLEVMALKSALESMAAEAGLDLVRLHGDSASARHREAGAEWMRRIGVPCDASDVLLCAGVQHGMAISLMSLLEPRDVLLAAEYTYPGLRSLASLLGVRLRPVALDHEGMIPESLDRACRQEPRPKAVYLVPTIQNPTCGTLSMERRRQIAEIAERHDVTIIEDHIHALLPEERPDPIATLVPERTVSIASPSKSIAPGLRVGFLTAPKAMRNRFLTAISSTIWTVPPLSAEVFTQWLETGMADRILLAKRDETAVRQEILDQYITGQRVQRDRSANHFWLHLPDSWSEPGFVRAARESGVLLPDSESFSVGRSADFHAVRVAIGIVTRDQLQQGLSTLRELLETSETPALTVI